MNFLDFTFEIFSLLIAPFMYVAAFACALVNYILDLFVKENCYKPSVFEWIHLGRKRFVAFRSRIPEMSYEEANELQRSYYAHQIEFDSSKKDLFNWLYPLGWFGVYAKALSYEISRR